MNRISANSDYRLLIVGKYLKDIHQFAKEHNIDISYYIPITQSNNLVGFSRLEYVIVGRPGDVKSDIFEQLDVYECTEVKDLSKYSNKIK